MVALSCFGALNGWCIFTAPSHRPSLSSGTVGSFYTSSRLIYAAARERYLPQMFGRLHKTRKTPLNATLLQAAITLTFVLIGGGFRSLINFSVVASWAFYFLTVGRLSDGKCRADPRTGAWPCHFTYQRAHIGAVRYSCNLTNP